MKQGMPTKLLMLTALGFTGGVIYYYPFVRFVFFDWQNAAMNLTATQMDF